MMPTGIKRIPAQAVIPGQAVAEEDITKVRSVSTSEMALCDVNNEAEETTGSLPQNVRNNRNTNQHHNTLSAANKY
jgi:hypothetical protein